MSAASIVFVVQPGVTHHPASYLLYVGKTGRKFRIRYREYLRHLKVGVESRRAHVSERLAK